MEGKGHFSTTSAKQKQNAFFMETPGRAINEADPVFGPWGGFLGVVA
jgi:hypothetical protein